MAENRRWTAAQTDAFSAEGRTLLVSAAAGSGKTSVLTQRIIHRVVRENGTDLSRVMIATFTRAAAAEMKDRIRRALEAAVREHPDNARALSQLSRLDYARIGTIDSMFYEIVRAHFDRLGIDASSRIGDETELSVLRDRCMEDTLDECYNDPDPQFGERFLELIDVLTPDRDDAVSDCLLGIWKDCANRTQGLSFLSRAAQLLRTDAESLRGGRDFFAAETGKDLAAQYRTDMQRICAELTSWETVLPSDGKVAALCRNDAEQFGILSANAGSYEHTRTALAQTKLKSAVGTKYINDPSEETYQAWRSGARDTLKHYQALLCPESTVIAASLERHAALQDTVFAVLTRFTENFTQVKRERNLLEFADVKRMAYDLLCADGEPTPLALEYRRTVDEIYIDEYQDLDELQDAVFAALAGRDNRFMVGDIKQSIYGFRGAAPALFAAYRNRFPQYDPQDGRDASTIFLSDNFRSSRGVIGFANAVCAPLFRHGSEVPYNENDDLRCGLDPNGEQPLIRPHVTVLRGKVNEGREAQYVAQEIRRLITEEGRDPEKIAVLARSRAPFSAVEDALREMQISYYNQDERSLFESAEIVLVRSLLRVVDNPSHDADLAGVLYSPLYGCTLDDVVRIRAASENGSLYQALCAYTEACGYEAGRRFLADMERYRAYARTHSSAEFVRWLYRESAVLSLCYANDPDETVPRESRRANLMLLYEFVRSAEERGMTGLYEINRYLDRIAAQKATFAQAHTSTEGLKSVQLMTIHKSKGLEFDTVFLIGCSRDFRPTPNRVIDREYGYVTELTDLVGKVRYKTLLLSLAKERIRRHELEEEIRVLYVALTRAKRELYAVGCSAKPERLLGINADTVQNGWSPFDGAGNCYMRWILCALAESGYTDWELTVPEEETDAQTADGAPSQPTDAVTADAESVPDDASYDEALCGRIVENLQYEYPYAYAASLPSKLSVSKLHPGILDELEESTVDVEAQNALTLRREPAFASAMQTEEDAVQRGTATHVFAQFCDFRSARERGARAELDRLVREQFLDPALAQLCDLDALQRMMESDLVGQLLAARRVWREQRFNITLPASEFADDPQKKALIQNETVLVQGVMDLVYESADGKLILVDYKTDHFPKGMPREEIERRLRARHARQLGYYRRACRQIFCRDVDACLIWSFALNDTVDVLTND